MVVSVSLPFEPLVALGRTGWGDRRGSDWADTARILRAAPRDQGDLSGASGIADDSAQGGALRQDRVQVRTGGPAGAEAGRVDRAADGAPGGGSDAAEAGAAIDATAVRGVA